VIPTYGTRTGAPRVQSTTSDCADANLAALAERWHGVAHGVEDIVLVLAGERLGAGIVVGGRLVRGAVARPASWPSSRSSRGSATRTASVPSPG